MNGAFALFLLTKFETTLLNIFGFKQTPIFQAYLQKIISTMLSIDTEPPS
jgi:hypothetical protein